MSRRRARDQLGAGNSALRWGWVSRLLHWVTAALVLFQLGLGLWMTTFAADLLERFRLTQIHKSWGVVIFFLALARVVWRLANRAAPGMPAGTPAWQARAAAASHRLLYGLLLVMPLSGWAAAAASPLQDLLGLDNAAFGIVLPDPWVPGDAAVEAVARAMHFWCAWLLTVVLAAHVAAALKHHFVDRDDVLARMTWGR